MGGAAKTARRPGEIMTKPLYVIFFGNMETRGVILRLKQNSLHINSVSKMFPKIIIIKSNLFPICFQSCFQLFPIVSKNFKGVIYE